MTFTLHSLADLDGHGFDTVIDVRSPAEFADDHIPGAMNLPVLSNAERAEVGLLYKADPFRARKLGAALVARNAADHLQGPLAERTGAWQPLVYCWRGGQRSGSFATILSQIGWRVQTLEGGYRSYRRLVVGGLYDHPLPHRFILIDGNTGTAKTEILARLAERGHQVIDLEGLSVHRGSVFGHREVPQPSQKAFDGALASALSQFDPQRPVLLEAESNRIGNCQVPPSLWARMVDAPRIQIEASVEARARYLVRAYRDLVDAPERIGPILEMLKPIQGAERIEAWQGLLQACDFETLAAELIRHHYDPRYTKSRARRGSPDGQAVDPPSVSLASLDPSDLQAALPALEKALAKVSTLRAEAPRL